MKTKKFISLRNIIIFLAVAGVFLFILMGGGTAFHFFSAQILPGQDIINTAQVTYKSTSGTNYGPTASNQVRTTVVASAGAFSFNFTKEGRTNVSGPADIIFKSVATGAIVKTVAVTSNTSGSGTTTRPPELISGTTYTVVLKIPYYLSKKISNFTWSLSPTLTFNQSLAGNLSNGDDTINTLDWSVMNSRWRTADAVADINGDGAVNTIDWSFMNKNWRAVGEE